MGYGLETLKSHPLRPAVKVTFWGKMDQDKWITETGIVNETPQTTNQTSQGQTLSAHLIWSLTLSLVGTGTRGPPLAHPGAWDEKRSVLGSSPLRTKVGMCDGSRYPWARCRIPKRFYLYAGGSCTRSRDGLPVRSTLPKGEKNTNERNEKKMMVWKQPINNQFRYFLP